MRIAGRLATPCAIALVGCGLWAISGVRQAYSEDFLVSTQSEYDAIRQARFHAGDRILFLRGSTFSGAFEPGRDAFNGDPKGRITIGTYGSGERPIIQNGGVDKGSIFIRDSGGWIIENLDVRNAGSNPQSRHGIYVRAEDSGAHNYFRVRDCIVQNVDGLPDGTNNAGIIFRVWGDQVPTEFNDIIVERNIVRNVKGIGIRIKSTWEVGNYDLRGRQSKMERLPFDDVIVRDNVVHDVTRNAIYVASSDGAVVERNRAGPNIATGSTGNSILNFATDDISIRNNEAFGNTGLATDVDRGGYDADYRSRRTRIEYNYSHDNNNAFSIMRLYNSDVHIRYNISENEKESVFLYGFADDDQIDRIHVYNNTIYTESPGMRVFMNYDRARKPINTTFSNNIFVFANSDATWGHDPEEAGLGNEFSHNYFFGIEPKGDHVLSANPQLINPGAGEVGIDFDYADRLGGYRLCVSSKAVHAGTTIADNGGRDYWGAGIGAETNVGAYEGDGHNCFDKFLTGTQVGSLPGKHEILSSHDHHFLRAYPGEEPGIRLGVQRDHQSAWILTENGEGLFLIENAQAGACLAASKGSHGFGLAPCDSSNPLQLWHLLDEEGNGEFDIVNGGSSPVRLDLRTNSWPNESPRDHSRATAFGGWLIRRRPH